MSQEIKAPTHQTLIYELRENLLNEFGFGEQYYALMEALSIVSEIAKEYSDYGYASEKIRHVKQYFGDRSE